MTKEHEKIMNKISSARNIIEQNEKNLEELHRLYGTGCRPSWVSADEYSYHATIRRCTAEIDSLSKQLNEIPHD